MPHSSSPGTEDPRCILVLGDQLSHDLCVLSDARPGVDVIVMAEVREETCYVQHNRHKLVLVLAAMRHFCGELQARGFTVDYYTLEDNLQSIGEALQQSIARHGACAVRCCEPAEYRLLTAMRKWQDTWNIPTEILADARFLCPLDDFRHWISGRKQPRMEHFYRQMRKRHNILLDDAGGPIGGKWNYDAENRAGWRNKDELPSRPVLSQDDITTEVMALVEKEFPANPGDLTQFSFAVTAEEAQLQFEWFLKFALPFFGKYQDAMAEESPWLFHSLVSMYLNIGLLCPLDVCRQVENAWRDDQCSLAAAEGFIRQVLGWREYVRGIYWHAMPEYARHNALQATRPLPAWFWQGSSGLRCLDVAITQSLDLGYAHHIQRLMIIGNFALLTGLDVKAVCDWYLAVYVDAYEWVELPNTLGMALYGDGGLMASKPYAASGKYIQRQGNHCKSCRFKPAKTTGEDACPYNSLYWRFIDRHSDTLSGNPRMSLILANWSRRDDDEKESILRWSEHELERLAPA